MRRTILLSLVFAAAAAAPSPAAVPHVVQPGETLWSIAAANNFTTRSFAAANGLPETASLIAGTTIQVPSIDEAAAALQRAGIVPAPAPAAAAAAARAPEPMGGYIVRPGDTLSALAA